MLKLYHGTPHDFLKFDTKNIGSGEGNQSFGYGLYFTDNIEIARHYASMLSQDGGFIYTVLVKDGFFVDWYNRLDETLVSRVRESFMKSGITELPIKRMLVSGQIMMKKLPLEQALRYYPNGKFFYENLAQQLGGDKNASQFLAKNGVMGIKYPVNTFRGNGGEGMNYVIFDENSIVQTNKQRNMGKETVTINESELRELVKEKIENVLRENFWDGARAVAGQVGDQVKLAMGKPAMVPRQTLKNTFKDASKSGDLWRLGDRMEQKPETVNPQKAIQMIQGFAQYGVMGQKNAANCIELIKKGDIKAAGHALKFDDLAVSTLNGQEGPTDYEKRHNIAW